jgi:3-polyprenyl-4-hydroxybenzoate decarboxylase
MIRVAIVISGKEGILNGTRACEHLNESKLRTDLCIVEYVDSIDKSAEAIIALITVCDQLMTDERNSCLTHLSTDFKVIDINKSIEMCNMIKTADYRTYCLEVIKKKK